MEAKTCTTVHEFTCQKKAASGDVRRTLSGSVFAPRSLRGSLNLRFSSLPLMTTLMVMDMSGEDAEVVAIVDDKG